MKNLSKLSFLTLLIIFLFSNLSYSWPIVCPSRWCFDYCGNQQDLCLSRCNTIECDTDCFSEYIDCTDDCGPDVCFIIP